MAFGLSLGFMGLGSRGAGGAAPLPYTLLSDFESTSGITSAGTTTLSLHTGTRRALGNGALRVEPDGSGGTRGYFNYAPLVGNPIDFSAFDRIAYCMDIGDFQYSESGPNKPNFRIGATVYGLHPPTSSSYSLPTSSAYYGTRGKVWKSCAMQYFRQTNASGTRIDSLGAVTPTFGAEVNSGFTNDYVIDALIAPSNDYVPNLVIGFDDLVGTQLSIGVPEMLANGLVGTFYVLTGNLATGTNTADLIAAKAAGFGLSLNSGPNDQPATQYATPAAWIADLQTQQATMLSTFGSSVAEDIKHVAYSYGRMGYVPDFTRTITCNGTTTLPMAGNDGFSCVPGQPIFGTGVPAGTVVVSITSGTAVVTNNAIPAGSRSLTFGGNPNGKAVTATGTDTVTVASTADLAVGFEVTNTFPSSLRGARIIAIPSATEIQLDQVIPSTCKWMKFGHTDGVWWHTKMFDAMSAAGFLSGRGVASSGTEGYFCGYGLDEGARLTWPGTGPSGATVALMMERLDRDIANGSDSEHYWHNISDAVLFADYCAAIKARVDAGLLTVKPKHVRIAEIMAFAPIEQI